MLRVKKGPKHRFTMDFEKAMSNHALYGLPVWQSAIPYYLKLMKETQGRFYLLPCVSTPQRQNTKSLEIAQIPGLFLQVLAEVGMGNFDELLCALADGFTV